MTMRIAILLAALALGACVMAEEPDRNACGAGGMQDLIGQDKSIFAAMTFPVGTRIIEPGMAIIEDYSPTRLNFDIGTDGRISRVWCG
jgi:Peptidase inhibitor I78 family